MTKKSNFNKNSNYVAMECPESFSMSFGFYSQEWITLSQIDSFLKIEAFQLLITSRQIINKHNIWRRTLINVLVVGKLEFQFKRQTLHITNAYKCVKHLFPFENKYIAYHILHS